MSDVGVFEDKYHGDSYWIDGKLPSGLKVVISDYYYDLRECVGRYVDMLLSFTRSPYCEQKRGIQNQCFAPFKYYSVKIVEDLVDDGLVESAYDESVVVLTGEYIDSYTIPEKWASVPKRGPFQTLYNEPSALKTEDGTFLLFPIHSRRQVPVEQIPREVTMAGGLKLVAWTSYQ